MEKADGPEPRGTFFELGVAAFSEAPHYREDLYMWPAICRTKRCVPERQNGGDIEAWIRASVAEAKARTPAKRSPRSKA
jgi:hypothetical protein